MVDNETSRQDAAPTAADPAIAAVAPADRPGIDEDDELASGIASIFAALHAAGAGTDDDDEFDDGAAEAHTLQLLGELDRLWQRPAPDR